MGESNSGNTNDLRYLNFNLNSVYNKKMVKSV